MRIIVCAAHQALTVWIARLVDRSVGIVAYAATVVLEAEATRYAILKQSNSGPKGGKLVQLKYGNAP